MISFASKLLDQGPITTNPEISVVVESAETLHGDRRECTCAICRTSHTQSPTNPDLETGECR
jgi:hypothetical protein